MYDSPTRPLLVTGKKTYTDVTTDIVRPVLGKPTKGWLTGMGIALIALLIGMFCINYTLFVGIGAWGLNKTVGWAFDITNFVFWVGIGHAGTLISAVLLLFRQKWRTGVNRSAEAMTIFAVICAAIFPGLHMGRPWLAYWIFPLPNFHGPIWINFNSPLAWDVFAIGTYFSVSILFWYSGLIPDFATIRDRAQSKTAKSIYNALSFGWVGSAKNWVRFESLSLILAGVSTPLVLSVHTIVSMDFATSVIPGWHTTIFPPYFVAGAIFSGFGMVLTLLVVARKVMNMEDYITVGHVEAMCKVVVTTGMMVGLAYATEFFIAFYSGSQYEMYTFYNRAFGPYGWSYWIMVSCNVLSPQFLWFKKLRTNMTFVFILSIFVNIGMWFERFVIIVTSLHRDLVPSSWFNYTPTMIEVGVLLGTFGIFFTLFLLFAKFFPVIAIAEIKSVMRSSSDTYRPDHISEEKLEEAINAAPGSTGSLNPSMAMSPNEQQS